MHASCHNIKPSKCREATRYKTSGGNQTEFTMTRRFQRMRMKGIENNSTSLTASCKQKQNKRNVAILNILDVTFLIYLYML